MSVLESEATFSAVERLWREKRRLNEKTITQYLAWVRSFLKHCRRRGFRPKRHLTRQGAERFAREYDRARRIHTDRSVPVACVALKRWSEALQLLGMRIPSWSARRARLRNRSTVLLAYAQYMRQNRGNRPKTITTHLAHLEHLLRFLQQRRRPLRGVRLLDIDQLLVERRRHWSVRTVADMCGVLRGFLRFLYLSGGLKEDLSCSIMAPIVRKGARPLRALPWPDVRRLLRGIKRTSAAGRRDYAVLLMMSAYGCGAGEVIGLSLQDIDWQGATLRVMRPKTGVEILLPLLPVMADALVDYLRHGRPRGIDTRALFVRLRPPYHPLASSSAVRHILCRHAAHAHIHAPFLGSHALRHAHACRQMELGTRPKLIGDILGHRDPESTSAYLRVATGRLRELALRVPR